MGGQLRFGRQGSSFGVEIDGRFSARISPEQSPPGLKTSGLEKGLLLARDGRDLAEGGMGFGVPVVRYRDEMYFSKAATLSPAQSSLTKIFFLDSVERLDVGGHVVGMGAASLARLYRASRPLRQPIIKVGELANRLVPSKAEFKGVPSRGQVSIKFEAHLDRIRVSCNLAELDRRGCQGIFILNEQGPSFFRNYQDSSGRRLVDGGIGAWERVSADEASLSDVPSTFHFSLKQAADAKMWLGREAHGDVAWAGLIYELPPSLDSFVYDIFLGRGGS